MTTADIAVLLVSLGVLLTFFVILWFAVSSGRMPIASMRGPRTVRRQQAYPHSSDEVRDAIGDAAGEGLFHAGKRLAAPRAPSGYATAPMVDHQPAAAWDGGARDAVAGTGHVAIVDESARAAYPLDGRVELDDPAAGYVHSEPASHGVNDGVSHDHDSHGGDQGSSSWDFDMD